MNLKNNYTEDTNSLKMEKIELGKKWMEGIENAEN